MHIHLDAVGGIAGDMFAAALVDAFPALEERVLKDARAVLLPAEGVPVFTVGASGGIACRRFGLLPRHGATRPRGHAERAPAHFRDLKARIGGLALSQDTARHAIGILALLAEAESIVHRVPVDEVHFHELADWDSLLDVVAAGSIIAALGPAGWSVSRLPRGGGLVHTQHGILPVPAPAATLLLQGFDFRDDGVQGERVTPTGAAILKYVGASSIGRGEGRLAQSGTGAGTRELDGMPNILRVLAFDAYAPAADKVVMIGFDVDDMTGEEIGVASDLLRATPGVRDVALGHLLGKKQRPMTTFQVIADPFAAEAVMDACFSLTSTIGLRWQEMARRTLPRAQSRRGTTGRKIVHRPGHVSTVKAESDDIIGTSLAARRRQRRLTETNDES